MTLRAFLLSWWRPPEDPDQRVAALTLPLATIFTLVVLLWIPVAIGVFGLPSWSALAALFGLAYATAAMLVRRRRAAAGARVLVATALLSTSAGVAATSVGGP